MKKVNVLAVVFLIAMMLVGTTYAVFTDPIHINNRLSTGSINIQIRQDSRLIASQGLEAELLVNKEDAIIDLKNLVPGSYAEFTIKFENTGNVDVILDDIEIIDLDGLLGDYLEITSKHIKNDNGNSIYKVYLRIDFSDNTPNELQNINANFKINTIFKQAI